MYGVRCRSTAAIHQPSEGAGSALWMVGWPCRRSLAMVDVVIRALKASVHLWQQIERSLWVGNNNSECYSSQSAHCDLCLALS